MRVIKVKDYERLSKLAAKIVATLIREKPDAVLGLATGNTPLGLYRELIRMHKEEGLDFSRVVTFNLDEYIGLPKNHPQSYHHFMWENFFHHVNINPSNVHIPDGNAPNIRQHCDWYEARIRKFGGIDLQILGIGRDGHIGFNEPGSSLGSRTRIKTLLEVTRRDNARFFDGKIENVPKYAITMGIGTILDAKAILLLASGESKADAIKKAVEGPITAMVPASVLQLHRDTTVIVDEAAAKYLELPWETEEDYERVELLFG